MTQAKFPVMLDEERAKYVTREIKYEQEIESLRQQLKTRAAEVTILREELNTIYTLVPDLVVLMEPSALTFTEQK